MNKGLFSGRHLRFHSKRSGFTLIELAVSLFIVALVLGAILVPLATQIEQRQVGETQKTMDEIHEVLVGYALANGYLPCPDVTAGTGANDGTEDVDTSTGMCQTINGTIATGNLPWATLGYANKDVWGNRFRYTVLDAFARRSPATSFSLTTPAATLRVCENASCASTSILSSTSVAVVISHGSNGFGAVNASTNTQNLPLPPVGSDERKNTNGDADVVSHVKTTISGSEFDDIVTSLSRFTLINRMASAGKLP